MIARTAFVASAVPLAAPHAPAGASPAACPRAPPVRIGYEVRGTGPVHVMFVPGMCISRRMWDAQIREFGKHPERYSLCLLDNRGAGESDIPPGGLLDARNSNYSLDTLARDAWTVADRVFGTSSKVHFIGWSMGSMVAQRIALLRLDRVASLALLSGNAGGWLWSNVPSIELVRAAVDIVCRGFDVSVAADVSLRLHFTESFLSEMVVDEEAGTKRLRRDVYAARYRHGIQRDAARDVDGSVFWGHLAAVRGHNLTRDEAERLRNAPFQTAVIYGEEDRVVTPAASRDLARRIGAVEHAVRGAHLIVDESSHEINRHLAALWKSCAEERRASNPLLGSHIIRSLANWASPLPDTSWAHFVKESR